MNPKAEVLLAGTDDPEIGLRLSFNPPGEFGIVLDREAEGDQVVEVLGSEGTAGSA